jgi:hypothetical protein
MSFGIPVRNGLSVGLLASTSLTSGSGRLVPRLTLNFLTGAPLDSRITFTRTTTATFVGSNGLLQTAAIDAPRFEYNPTTLAPLGLLIEEQRTNLARYSEQFDNAAWVKFATATVTANTSTAPDGTTTADTLNMPASGDRINLSAISITGGATYTASLWLSGSGTTFISLATGGGTYKFAGQQVTLTATPTRYTVTLVTNANNTSVFPIIGRYNGAVGAGTATSAIIWGYQFEAGAFATSYIPTVASTVTRTADIAVMTGTNFSSWYNASEGTFVASASTYSTASDKGVYAASDGTNDNRIYLVVSTSADHIVTVSSAQQANITIAGAVTNNTVFRDAFAYRENDISAATNGVLGTPDTLATLPVVDQFRLGARSDGGLWLNGHLSSITYYPSRLTDAQLQALSA